MLFFSQMELKKSPLNCAIPYSSVCVQNVCTRAYRQDCQNTSGHVASRLSEAKEMRCALPCSLSSLFAASNAGNATQMLNRTNKSTHA